MLRRLRDIRSKWKLIVPDEADRSLDMGFARTLNALLSHLPRSLQMLLFSATQTDSVKDLARLRHNVTLDVLWSSNKAHLQSKILVFMSSGKQVRETIGDWLNLKVPFILQVKLYL